MQKKDRSKKSELIFQKKEAEIKLNKNKEQIRELQKEGVSLMRTISQLDENINNFEDIVEIKVTDHAVCRYLERFKGVDIEEVRMEVANIAAKGKVIPDIKSWKAITGNHKIVVKENEVITIMERK